ncbi:hypothetical protein Scep_004036 [Stephania cephalantha]|uniref:Reverse transcriptase Ty1/copia-type domain-containing protein n=1 Tax=Stephania cephalantha TaxID=152367 RepID=A0AAP0PUZ5_9MAGN
MFSTATSSSPISVVPHSIVTIDQHSYPGSSQSQMPPSSSVSPTTLPQSSPPQSSLPQSPPPQSSPVPLPTNTHQMITRGKNGISMKKVFTATCSDADSIPSTVEMALSIPHWREAMEKEYQALMKNDTWSLVSPSKNQNVVANKWIFTVKKNSDGTVNRYKARLVAKGFKQIPGIDFSETYSPVIKSATIRIIFSIAVTYGWSIRQIDINNAFLNGQLMEEVYTHQPAGFVDDSNPHHVCRLHKALYGLRQAPRAWFDQLKGALLSWGFQNSKADSSLFITTWETSPLYVLIYVDDIIVTGAKPAAIQSFINKLNTTFALKDIGELSLFLGFEVRRDASGLYLNQSSYISSLLLKAGMSNAKVAESPAASGKQLCSDSHSLFHDPSLYRSLLGGLQYVVHTRPDIAFIVNRLSSYQQSPSTSHWQALKRVLRFLKGTLHLGLSFKPGSKLMLTGYSDADWAANPDDRKSIAGFAVYFGSNLISWQSKKQAVVARSSTESEYRALAHVAAEVTWIRSLLTELHFPLPAVPVLWCDNLSAASLARNPVFHSRTKHIEIDIHFVRDKVLQGDLSVQYVPTHDQIADCFTKALSTSRFHELRIKLGVIPIPLRLRGDVRINH